MLRTAAPVLIIAALAGTACNGDRDGDDGTLQQDTLVQTVPREDTLMIERTVTEDTLQRPDGMRDDTLRQDTARRP